MKTLVFLSAILFTSINLYAQEEKDMENDFLKDFLVGEYNIIGKKIESTETYSGTMKIENIKGKFKVTRQIKGKKIVCKAEIKENLPDETKIFVITCTENNNNYEIAYMIDTDFDNYPRLSAYVYIKGTYPENPGLEAAFSIH